MKVFTKGILSALLVAMILPSCGKKKKEKTNTDETTEALVSSGALMLQYATGSLSSTQKAPTSTLAINASDARDSDSSTVMPSNFDSEIRSTKTPSCSNKGSPWNSTTNRIMYPEDVGVNYAEAVLYCQTNNDESPDTLAGSMRQAEGIICDVEKLLGTVEYTADGKSYANVLITPTAACGWTESQIAEISALKPKATITATSYATGDWQRSLHLVASTVGVDIKLYSTATASKVAMKFVEGWDADARGDAAYAGISPGSKGSRGNVISIDRVGGVIRAEYADTYWGRRARIYAKGTLDATTGEFGSVTDMSGAFSDLGVATSSLTSNIYGSFATVSGTASGGFKFNSGSLAQSGATVSTAITFSTANSSCQPTTGCSGNSGITFSAVADDLKFFSVGGAHDAYNATRAAFQTWLDSAGDLTFTEFSRAASL